MVPYGLNQKVEFKKNFGPHLGNLNLDNISKLDEIDFVKKVYPVYKAIKKVSHNKLLIIKYHWICWCSMDTYCLHDKQQSPKKELNK